MVTLKSMLIVMVVLLGLLGALGFTSVAMLEDCSGDNCTTAHNVQPPCCARYRSDELLPYAIAGGGVKPPGVQQGLKHESPDV